MLQASFLLAILFVTPGVWKITNPFGWAARVIELRVPGSLALMGACVLGVLETYGGVLIFVPRFRRWGAWLVAALLLFFMVYIGIYYNVLRGADCNCFPWIKRVVGPAFFVSDLVMLALAVIAGWWARPAASRRGAVLVLLAVAVFAAVSYGVNARIEASIVAPASIHVEGKPFALRHGQVLLFFFDPECTHCEEAARAMSKLRWTSGVAIIAIPTESPQFAREFLQSTGLRGSISSDAALLRKTFSFVSTPYAVALENGRNKASLSRFDEREPEQTLRRLHFIH